MKGELRTSLQELEKTRQEYSILKIKSEKETKNNLGKIKNITI